MKWLVNVHSPSYPELHVAGESLGLRVSQEVSIMFTEEPSVSSAGVRAGGEYGETQRRKDSVFVCCKMKK